MLGPSHAAFRGVAAVALSRVDRRAAESKLRWVGQACGALRYAVTTEAGSLPRSLTVNPFWRAHARSSALLGEPTERGADFFTDCLAAASAEGATGSAFAAADGVFFTVFLLLPGLLALFLGSVVVVFLPALFGVGFGFSPETTSVTPYRAPRTRIASSRDSLESSVSFKAVTFRHVRRTATRPP